MAGTADVLGGSWAPPPRCRLSSVTAKLIKHALSEVVNGSFGGFGMFSSVRRGQKVDDRYVSQKELHYGIESRDFRLVY